jgi:hypothetical protein
VDEPIEVMESDTLRIKWISTKTLWLTLVIMLVFGGIAEMLVRTESFQTPLTPPKMGSSHYQLGHKLALLQNEVKKNGAIDCIMVGSSMVDVGFNAGVFQNAYQEIAGRDIQCFNFGIDASTAASSFALVSILIEDYHPRLLIFGTDPRDYAVPSTDRDPSAVLAAPWVKYRQGGFSLEGWLQDHSYLHRYRQHISRLVRFQFEGTLWSQTHLNFPILPNGFTPLSKVSTYVNDPPSPQDDSYEVTYYTRIYSNYQMLDENLAALEYILSYNGSATQVVVVEMPISDGLYYFFGNGEADYNHYVDRVSGLANLYNVPFWRTEPLDSIPDDGWSDYSHLNVDGAEIFSTWLGERVGEAQVRGNIEILNP